jgi:hypothetical protein
MGVRTDRTGAVIVQDDVMALAKEGRIFCANGGTVTSPLTFGAGNIDTTEPDFFLSTPSGTTATILEIRVKIEAYGSNAIFELMAASGTGGVAGTDTDLVAGTTINSLRSDYPVAVQSSAGVASAADATYMTANVAEFWRDGLMKAVTTATADDDSPMPPQTFVWSYKNNPPVVLVGAAQLMVFAAGQATTGFITVLFAEEPSNSIT